MSTPALRWAQNRDEFLQLLDQLHLYMVSVSGDIHPKQSKSVLARVLEDLKLRKHLRHYQDAGDRLKELISTLRVLPETNQVAFQLRLYNNPSELQALLKESSKACGDYFQAEGAAFYMKLQSEPTQQADPSQEPPEAKYLIFDVSTEEEASEAGERIASVREQLLSATPHPSKLDWGAFLGHMGKTIRVISDSTTRLPGRSLITCLTDRGEQKVLQEAGYAGARARLAFIAASSLFYSLRAEGTQDLEAQDLTYYTALDKRKREPGYKESRVIPFVPLTTLGATAFEPSSADTLSGRDELKATMIKKLGILIYEIGVWTNVADTRLEARVSKVKTGKGHLESMHPKYPDVIDACLRYKKDGSVEDWLVKHVVLPLKEVYESIERYGVRPV